MSHKNSLSSIAETDQLVVSYELLLILRWIIDHNHEELKHLLAQTLASSQAAKKVEALNVSGSSTAVTDDIRHAIVDFFDLLETLLAEISHEQSITKLIERKLMPAIEHIDSTVCEEYVIQNSLEKTAHKIDDVSKEQVQDVLFKEILKQWKPTKKNVLN